MIIHSLPEGTTAPQVFQLTAENYAGDPVDLTLEAFTVTIEVYDKYAAPATGMGTVQVLTNDIISFTPNPAKWKASMSPYTVRWVVTSDEGGVFKVPNSVQPDVWQVSKP